MEPGSEVEMLEEITGEDGNLKTLDDVYISYCTKIKSKGGKETKVMQGKLSAGYGGGGSGTEIGPEYTFGIYMRKHLNEPILIIKTAWGGKSLNTDFRSPSAGLYGTLKKTGKAAKNDAKLEMRQKISGVYYRLMIEQVKKVLADPGKVHPAYDAKLGYDLEGFVWFQGWNDAVDSKTYPNRNKPDGYALYTELLSHFIRDVRKDLSAPKMPFVIGVMGVGGESTAETAAKETGRYAGINYAIQSAMAKPASLPEFKDNVIAVQTGKSWDPELERLEGLHWKVAKGEGMKAALAKAKEKKKGKLRSEDIKEIRDAMYKQAMTEEGYKYWTTGRSNQSYHYLGSAKILGRIGRDFAKALADWHTKNPSN